MAAQSSRLSGALAIGFALTSAVIRWLERRRLRGTVRIWFTSVACVVAEWDPRLLASSPRAANYTGVT
jgi:hypothetical protein